MKQTQYRIGKNCIYCFTPIAGELKTKDHILSKSLGGTFPIPACKEHNQLLGSTVENWLSVDYWINFAKRSLKLKNFKLNPNFQFSAKTNEYKTLKLPNGKEKLIAPYTDKTTWRIIAKYFYGHLAFLIGNDIFKEEFHTLRDYILRKTISNINEKEWFVRCVKKENETNKGDWNILRCSYYQIPLDAVHIIEFYYDDPYLSIKFYLFGFYVFDCSIVYTTSSEVSGKLPARILYDLRNEDVILGELSENKKEWTYKSMNKSKKCF